MDLLTLAKSRLDLASLTNLAEILTIDPNVVPSLIDELLPTLFGIFQQTAADPAKASVLDEIVSSADPSLLDNPALALEKDGPAILRSGKATLARLLGPQLTDHLAPLAKATGLGEGKVASALGLLAPFVTSLLARHASNSNELHHLLAEQNFTAPPLEPKIKAEKPKPEKSYLPDPNKPKPLARRPRRKLILILILLILGLLTAYLLSPKRPTPPLPTPPPSNPQLESSEKTARALESPLKRHFEVKHLFCHELSEQQAPETLFPR